jgi:hypothetical protein
MSTHEYAIASLQRRLGMCLSRAKAHENDSHNLHAEAARALEAASSIHDEMEGLKLSIIALGGDPSPSELQHEKGRPE